MIPTLELMINDLREKKTIKTTYYKYDVNDKHILIGNSVIFKLLIGYAHLCLPWSQLRLGYYNKGVNKINRKHTSI